MKKLLLITMIISSGILFGDTDEDYEEYYKRDFLFGVIAEGTDSTYDLPRGRGPVSGLVSNLAACTILWELGDHLDSEEESGEEWTRRENRYNALKCKTGLAVLDRLIEGVRKDAPDKLQLISNLDKLRSDIIASNNHGITELDVAQEKHELHDYFVTLDERRAQSEKEFEEFQKNKSK